MRTKSMMGLLAVTLATTAASAQTAGLQRPSSTGLRPSATAAPSTGAMTPKPAAGSAFARPGASSFARPTAAAPTEEAPAPTEDAAAPTNSFNPSSRFGGSSFTPASEATAPASNRFRGLSDQQDEVPQPEPETQVQPAPAVRSFNPQGTQTTQPRMQPSGATAPRTMTPGNGATTMPSRSFGSGATSTTTSSTTTTPRSTMPTRSLGTRVASAAPAPTTMSTPAEAASPVAEQLLQQSIEPRAQHELPGQPVPLSQVVERGGSGASRIRAVQTYWKLVTKVALYHAAVDDRNLFAQLNVRQLATHDRSALAAAQLAAEAAKNRAELDFVNTQHELSEIAQFSDVELQALPSDLPLVSEYRTHFTTLYGSRSAPSGLRRLDRSMPYHLKNVRSRADSVVAAQQALQAAVEAVTTGQASVSSLLEVHQHFSRERIAFNSAVYDYNAMIAEYALNVAPNQSPGTIVGMLIKTKPAARAATVIHEGAVVRTVSSEEPLVADHAPQLHAAQGETIEYAMPRQQQPIEYPAEEAAPLEESTEDPAVIMADESPAWRR